MCWQANKYSCGILHAYEREKQVVLTDKNVKKAQLSEAAKLCGLAPSKFGVVKLRALVVALKKHELPLDPQEVVRALLTRKMPTNGIGICDVFLV